MEVFDLIYLPTEYPWHACEVWIVTWMGYRETSNRCGAQVKHKGLLTKMSRGRSKLHSSSWLVFLIHKPCSSLRSQFNRKQSYLTFNKDSLGQVSRRKLQWVHCHFLTCVIAQERASFRTFRVKGCALIYTAVFQRYQYDCAGIDKLRDWPSPVQIFRSRQKSFRRNSPWSGALAHNKGMC